MAFFSASALAFAMLPSAAGHGWVTVPVSKNELAVHHYQNGMPTDFRYEPQSSNIGNLAGGMSLGAGYACGAKDPLTVQGLGTWQKWYDAAKVEVPRLVPGEDIRFNLNLTIDHGGQSWVEVACADSITEDLDWILLERAQKDRGHHFMPSTPGIFAWAPLELQQEHNNNFDVWWTVPADFSCPSGQGMGRWLWKTGNSCEDSNNVGRHSEPFNRSEWADVFHAYKPGAWVLEDCTAPPEQFISCFDFVVASSPAPSAKFQCVNDQCVAASEGVDQSTCQAACQPTKFECVNNQCVATSSGGVDGDTCRSVCGTFVL